MKKLIQNAENYQIERKYADVFEIFEKGYLGQSERERLLNILRKLDSKTLVKDNFNTLRKILEAIFISLNQTHNQLIPNRCIIPIQNRPNLTWVWHYLRGEVRYPDRTSEINTNPLSNYYLALISFLQEITDINSHNYPANPSDYAYKSTVFALLEMLLWFKSEKEK